MTQDAEIRPIKGRHKALVRAATDGVQFSYVGKDDKVQAILLFDLTDPNDVDYGSSISAFLFFTEATEARTIESFRHCGWEGEEVADLPQLAAEGKLNSEVELVIDHEFYQPDNGEGRWQAKVKWINKPGGGAVQVKKPLDNRQLADFSTRMKQRLRQMPASNGGGRRQSSGSNPNPSHPNAPGGANDDIPF